VYKLANTVKDYPWGSTDAIPRLLGSTPSGAPQAELWIGTHPAGPSKALTGAGEKSLRDVIAADPTGTLGSAVADRFGTELPFLLKVLSAAKPLSLQVHPSKEQAAKGYAAEDAAGIPLDAPQRNFKDRNHKPELLFALTDFDALSGFKPPAASAALLTQIRERSGHGGVLEELIGDLGPGSEREALRAATERLLTLDKTAAHDVVAAVVQGCGGVDDPSARTALDLFGEYGFDAGVVLSLLINRITLSPGEAIFLPAGNLHAYLRGTGVELMASSDNVLRGGLTSKHIDVPALLEIVDFSAGLPMRPQPVTMVAGRTDFPVPVDDFRLSVLDLEAGSEIGFDEAVPRTALVLEGEAAFAGGTGSTTLRRGESAFIAAGDAPVAISGSGRVVIAAPGT
jgi:mannose-6-phosphate isomerase